MKICNNISQTIGNTPLVRFRSIEKAFGLEAKIYAKIESFNPAGSAKDRVALFMINDAEEKGLIQPGATIIEPTSGNTGIGLAAVGLSRGYKGNPDHAGDHEHRKGKSSEGVWSFCDPDRRVQGYAGGRPKGRGAG